MLNLKFVLGGTNVNWGYLVLRIAIVLGILTLLFLSQRFWYRALWRVTSNWGRVSLRVSVRVAYILALLVVIFTIVGSLSLGQRRIVPQPSIVSVLTGLWFFSALFAYLAVKVVHGLERVWRWLHAAAAREAAIRPGASIPSLAASDAPETVADPGRRYFFRAATAAAGAAPVLGAMYGFAAERLNYQVRRIEIPIQNLPSALDGMQIVQISDIHLSGYMSPSQVRRAVDMANDLGADLAVVTGDLITGMGDSISDCVDEVRRLHTPLGTWGCNGNHEIYAGVEDEAAELYSQAGMKLLRQENAQINFKGAQFNLIGVDYQRERTPRGQRQQTLINVAPLVRRDMPNILLSHNPNTFNRAAELGVELSLAGHTHGGQIQVEILDHRLSPARFITDYIAGLYQRPLFAPALTERGASNASATRAFSPSLFASSSSGMARLYVNRGLGTVGAPVRLGVPPEISLIVLRTA
jgi:predicted MPP superfamily phosphohydrolase